jgi:hypothetical protein
MKQVKIPVLKPDFRLSIVIVGNKDESSLPVFDSHGDSPPVKYSGSATLFCCGQTHRKSIEDQTNQWLLEATLLSWAHSTYADDKQNEGKVI